VLAREARLVVVGQPFRVPVEKHPEEPLALVAKGPKSVNSCRDHPDSRGGADLVIFLMLQGPVHGLLARVPGMGGVQRVNHRRVDSHVAVVDALEDHHVGRSFASLHVNLRVNLQGAASAIATSGAQMPRLCRCRRSEAAHETMWSP